MKKVLLSLRYFENLRGTETFTYTLAEEFKQRGWEVHFYVGQTGTMTPFLKRHGTLWTEEPKQEFDLAVIQQQQWGEKIKAKKKIYISHGIQTSLDEPAKGMDAYFSVSEEVKKKWGGEVLRNPVDLLRFKSVDSNKKPLRAFILSHYREVIDPAFKACLEEGVTPHLIDTHDLIEVEKEMGYADIVITVGRGVVEAMACNKFVIVAGVSGFDGVCDEENYYELRKHNFSGRRYARSLNPANFVKAISQYKNSSGMRDYAKKYHDVKQAVDNLLDN